jgi:hypothetical protein
METFDERIPPEHRDLFGIRTDTPYTEGERRYSRAVQMCLEELLRGQRQQIILLRRYYGGRERIDVMRAPPDVDREELRLPVVERLLMSIISFVRDVSPGGPVFQYRERDQLVEVQPFSTKYPHIIIERVDTFGGDDRVPLFTEWRLRRTQNQRMETQINRWLDGVNLAFSFLKGLRGQG